MAKYRVCGFAAVMVLIVAGCAPQYPKYSIDQQARQRIFKECMAALPEGPKSTQYNDWAEVVDECDAIAADQAKYCYANCAPPVTEAQEAAR